jgi:Domain of unknown function (DUF4145)
MADLATNREDARPARAGETIAAAWQKEAFHCGFCQVFTTQKWFPLYTQVGGRYWESKVWACECTNCEVRSYWSAPVRSGPDEVGTLMYPLRGQAPAPHHLLPDDVRKDYDEAVSIVVQSPRGACAILRLALQKLMPHLGQKGKNLDDDIAALVKGGLDPGVQQALDALRVIGNNAVHPGELDLRDDVATAQSLFEVLNYIVEQQIERPQKLAALYQKLPEGARKAIAQRDHRALPASSTN